MAAVIASGKRAVLSHGAAAALWKLLAAPYGPVDVSVADDSGRARRAGIRLYRRRWLSQSEVTSHRGIPVTTPARTLADLRRTVAPALYRRAVRQAEVKGMRTDLEQRSVATRSELEDRFLALCRKHRLPPPEVNVQIGRYEVDFLWRPQQVIAETDGYRYHRGNQAFEDDHDRDLDLRAQGYDVHRFTYRQVTDQSPRVAAAVRSALG
jgi:very-short-patch-repair endonuclease